MIEITQNINTFYFVIFFLIIIQSMIGIGVLVLGTPILLFLNYSLPDLLSVLLPISILTSLTNILVIGNFNFQNKKNKRGFVENYIPADKSLKNMFYFICLPSVFIGLIILKSFGQHMNFKIIISFVIFSSLIIKLTLENKITNISQIKKKFFLFLIGLVHGLSNSGGTLLALMLTSINKDFKLESRMNITFFYLVLALAQYSIFLIIFKYIPNFYWVILMSIFVFIGSLLGDVLIKIIKQSILRRFIDSLALLSAIFLLFDGFELIKFN